MWEWDKEKRERQVRELLECRELLKDPDGSGWRRGKGCEGPGGALELKSGGGGEPLKFPEQGRCSRFQSYSEGD